MNTEELLKRDLGLEVKSNVSLKPFNTINVGGMADCLVEAKNVDNLCQIVRYAESREIPYLIIGQGSDIIFSDSGFAGLVIVNKCRNIVFSAIASEVIVDSGMPLAALINLAAGRDLGGLEFLAGIGGTIGGAIYGNYTQGEKALGDFVKSVTVIHRYNGEAVISSYPGAWLKFGRFTTNLKTWSDEFRPVILTAKIQLVRRRKDEVLSLIRGSQNANRIPVQHFIRDILFSQNSDHDLAALIKKSGCAKSKMGGAATLSAIPNIIINQKFALASDIRILIERIREAVMTKTGVELIERVEYLGQW